jgi:hypothetical protein
VIKYVCDWCQREFPLNGISTVKVSNVYNTRLRLHICRDCGRSHMPQSAQASLSWTAND